MPFEISADVPPQEPGGAPFGLTLQFESNDTALGEADVTTVNFGSGITATRGLSGDPNKIDLTVSSSGGGDNESVPGVVTDGTTDNLTAMSAALGPTGTFVAGLKSRAKLGTIGPVKIGGLLDVDPSISVPNDGRGINVLVPGDNLPATTAAIAGETPPSGVGDGSGADAAFVRIPRSAPDSAHNLAYSYTWRGLNLDASGTTQTNPVHGIRIPNPDKDENAFDPDPNFTGNKDYVCGEFYNMDIVGWPGSGFVGESSNGRAHLHSVRFLNNGRLNVAGFNHGADLGGNDIVVSGHSAAGGNKGSGWKIGNASGFFATTVNSWGDSGTRGLTVNAAWMNQRKCFAWLCSEFNDWVRMTGGSSYWRGGTISLNCFAPFNDNFDGDGIAFDFTSGGPNPKLQAHIGIDDYQSVNFIGNQYQRSTAVNKASQPGGAFTSWMNVGGDLAGQFGTAHQKFLDVSSNAMVNSIDTVNSGPNVRPWTGPQATFTVTIASPGVFTSVAHGRSNGDRLALTTTGALPTGLSVGITLFVIVIDVDTFKLARTPGGTAINTTGSQSGTHTWGALSTLPYDTHGGSQVNFLLMDSFKNETRIGALGRTHSKVLIGLPSTDFGAMTGSTANFTVSGNTATSAAHGLGDGAPLTLTTTGTLPGGLSLTAQVWVTNPSTNTFQFAALPGGNAITLADAGTGTHTFWSWSRTYMVEAGDHTQPGGVSYRNALHGVWEVDNALQYPDIAYDARTTGSGSRTVQAGHVYQLFSTAGGGIASYAVSLPTELKASYELVMNFTGGPITALTFATTPTAGRINTNSFQVPAGSPGAMSIRWLYRHDTNQWYVMQVMGGDSCSVIGRTDGSGPTVGTLGEKARLFTPVSSAIAMTTGTVTAISAASAGILLGVGVWDIFMTAGFSAASSPIVTDLQWGINTANNALPSTKDESYGTRQFASLTASSIFAVETCFKEVNLNAAQTFYPVAQADFTVGTVSGYSTIWARRSG